MSRSTSILLALPLLIALGTPEAADARGQARSNPGSGQCNGQDIRISQSNFRIVLSGNCGHVTINGSNGSINVENARRITVNGSQVRVLNRQVDNLTVNGSSNTLNMTRVEQAEVTGSNNRLLGRHYGHVRFIGSNNYVNTDNTPQVDDIGSGNRVR